jgi:hypothetical protein
MISNEVKLYIKIVENDEICNLKLIDFHLKLFNDLKNYYKPTYGYDYIVSHITQVKL